MKLILLLLFPVIVHGKTISGSGQAKIYDKINLNSACLKAENNAIENALITHFGKEFTSTKTNYCHDTSNISYCDYYKEFRTHISGTIKEIVRTKTDIWGGVCFVDVKLVADKSRYFDVFVRGRNSYKVGDKLHYEVSVNEPFYMYVFNIHRKGVEFLFPHDYNKDNLVNKGYEFPGNGMKYVMYLNDNMEKDEETILFLFTKHKLNFDRLNVTEEVLSDVIDSIPHFSKRVVKFNIFVRK